MTMRNISIWANPQAEQLNSALLTYLSGQNLLTQVLTRRGIRTIELARQFLEPDQYPPALPTTLPDLVQAAELLDKAIRHRELILIWGDFDVDGQTATALLLDAIKRLGGRVEFYIPHRVRESHGIKLESLRAQILTPPPALLLTCDTGISEHLSIDYAKSQGIQVVITDHHDLPPTLPNANAVVNPKRLSADHPLASLPGAGVVYKLIEHLYTLRGKGAELADFLDLVALGIVADVAQLTGDTRYLLQIGLEKLRNSERLGIKALIEVAGLNPDTLTAADIGFQLGPRLNAAGRLGDARLGVELLTTPDIVRARVLATTLEGLNTQRRLQNRQIYTAAQEQIARDPTLLDWQALVLAQANWHPGIIGIVAGQLAERYQKPVVMLSINEDGTARGSARSVPGYNIGAAIAAQADILLEYGGHPGAAGLSLPIDNLPMFRRRLSNTLRENFDPSTRSELVLDAILPLSELSLELATSLERLAPFGEGNPRPILATMDLRLRSAAFLGRDQQHRKLTVEDASGVRREVIWWNSADQTLPDDRIDLAYEIDINQREGQPELRLTLIDLRRAASAPPIVIRPPRQFADYRTDPRPDARLSRLHDQYPDAVIWAEGYRQAESPGAALPDLRPAPTLIIYTAPYGPQALQEALKRVDPAQVVLLGLTPPLDSAADVQRRILELVKFVMNRQNGQTTIAALAAAAGQSPQTIELGLEYSEARGDIRLETKQDRICLLPGSGLPSAEAAEKLAAFQAAVAETRAYRAFFKRAEALHLLGWDEES
ncbi:MAG TPA: single-stranded-DNA-specific exonuclease RecJ [Aggregatilineaceae bacterium]|nr:single-stranded-DNA-specific exonuclease RecJ [Aggregatilineaceae bacterium]